MVGTPVRSPLQALQRWRHRLAPHGADLEQAVRTVWLETQPRQAGDAFPCGVPPPLRPGPWRDRAMVYRLTAALSMVLGLAIVSNQAVASLLAEAKRRLPTNPFFTA